MSGSVRTNKACNRLDPGCITACGSDEDNYKVFSRILFCIDSVPKNIYNSDKALIA